MANISSYNEPNKTNAREEPTMLTILRDYFESRRRMRVISGDFFRNGMHCDLLPLRRVRKTQTRWMGWC